MPSCKSDIVGCSQLCVTSSVFSGRNFALHHGGKESLFMHKTLKLHPVGEERKKNSPGSVVFRNAVVEG